MFLLWAGLFFMCNISLRSNDLLRFLRSPILSFLYLGQVQFSSQNLTSLKYPSKTLSSIDVFISTSFVQTLIFCLSILFLTGCEINYLWRVSSGQADLLSRRVSLEKALKKYEFSEDEKKKLQLIPEIKKYTLGTLKLDIDEDIYSTYVHLDQPYVSWLVRVSAIYELKAHEWNFPIIGKAPYKGFFEKEKAIKEAESFPKDKYDTFVRGVSAYSTLNWFEDPIYSSMLKYSERDFVVTIFHELAHSVLFFDDHINFNERFAEYIGRKAALYFYIDKEGSSSETVNLLQREWEDEILFSSFMKKEYDSLNKWYVDNRGKVTQESKEKRIREIQDRFIRELKGKLKTDSYGYFSNIKLNNARLLSYRSYNYDMTAFEKLFNSSEVNKELKKFIEYCSRFEKEKNPEEALYKAIAKEEVL